MTESDSSIASGRAPVAPGALRQLRHQLRTPVNHLLGYAELLLEDTDDTTDVWTANLQRIVDASLAMLDPIDAVIEAVTAQVDAGPMMALLRPMLSDIGAACDVLDVEAVRLGHADALHDLAIIRTAAADLGALLATPLDAATAASESEMPPAAVTESRPAPMRPGVILVVDDNAHNRDMVSRRLARLGHTVITASGGLEALELLGERDVDLLLLDVMMPEMDGFEVLSRIKANRAWSELPVIMLSALDEVGAAVRCIEMGADDYLPKPVDAVLLRARIGACLERKRLRDTEASHLRQAAWVTGPAIIAQVLVAANQLDPDETELLAAVQREAEYRDLRKGETLFTSGDDAMGLYVVLSGRLRVDEQEEQGTSRGLGEARTGWTLGEREMLTRQRHTTTVTAIRDARLACISLASFQRLAAAYPRLLTRTSQDVIDRIRGMFERQPASASVTTFALVPIARDVPIVDVARRLARALTARGSTLLLDREHLASELGAERSQRLLDGSGADDVVPWLNEIELLHRYVIYQADIEPSAWTSRCLRQADQVVLVGQGQPTDDIRALRDEISRNTDATPIDLLLLHDSTTPRPIATEAWLDRWDVRLHHHLRLDDEASLGKTVRRLTGTSIDLVLGGGGARGWAHVGVIRALDEAGIAVDAIAGTSIGALIGAGRALGMTWQDFHDHARTWSSPRRLFDYTLPFVSFFSGKKISLMLEAVYGDVRIEDMWCEFFCISSSLTRARPIIHRQGPVWRAVRASISLPALLPPILHEGEFLIDGAYLNNLPTDVMRDLYQSGTIIAVSVNEPPGQPVEAGAMTSLSGWDVLRGKIVPRARVVVPSLPATVMRTGSLSGSYTLGASMRLADLAIEPAVGNFGSLDFAAYQQIIDTGYEDACRQIEAWQRSRTGM